MSSWIEVIDIFDRVSWTKVRYLSFWGEVVFTNLVEALLGLFGLANGPELVTRAANRGQACCRDPSLGHGREAGWVNDRVISQEPCLWPSRRASRVGGNEPVSNLVWGPAKSAAEGANQVGGWEPCVLEERPKLVSVLAEEPFLSVVETCVFGLVVRGGRDPTIKSGRGTRQVLWVNYQGLRLGPGWGTSRVNYRTCVLDNIIC